MAAGRSWWRARRAKHRDGVALCVLSAALLLAGELSTPVLADVYARYLQPALSDPVRFVVLSLLAVFAFTTAFGAVLVLAGGWAFLVGRVSRGRFLVSLGVGLTGLIVVSRLAYALLVFGTPAAFLLPLATTLSGLGALVGVAAQVVMGQYALLLKKHALIRWRRWRRARRARA